METPNIDRANQARWLADEFARTFPPTLPAPGTDAVAPAGRHVRLSAETPNQIYLAGNTQERDARARINARASGMPNGWTVRLTIVESTIVPLNLRGAGSRADPVVLRTQRQMNHPAAMAQLAGPLRAQFPQRPIQSDAHSLFIQRGMAFVREASVVIPVPDDRKACAALLDDLRSAASAGLDSGPSVEAPAVPSANARRAHLRVIQ